ncbi:hypothetical protein AcW2_004756 [Taiwanofungus camphoratus]|nr:hypothetical protein AcW2_004756 [Antrodia cinnamomea]
MVQFEIMKRACTDTLSMTGLRSHWRSSGERIVPPSQQMKRGMTASCSSCISISPIASQALGVGGDEWRCERCGDMPARDARSDIRGAWPADGRDNPKAASRDAGCVQRRSTGRAEDETGSVHRVSCIEYLDPSPSRTRSRTQSQWQRGDVNGGLVHGNACGHTAVREYGRRGGPGQKSRIRSQAQVPGRGILGCGARGLNGRLF